MGATMIQTLKPGTYTPFYPEFPGGDAIASETAAYTVGGEYKGPGHAWYFLEDLIKKRKGIKKMYETPGKN